MPDQPSFAALTATIIETASSTIAKLTWKNVAVGASVFTGTLIVNLLLLGVVLVAMPPTYLRDDHGRGRGSGAWTFPRIARKIAMNLVGLVLVAIGIITSLPGVPGQGVLTIVIGIALTDVPGKRRIARSVLGRENVLRRVNAFRRRFGTAPLLV